MGYDAYVRCNCYKEGKINKPYFSEYLIEDIEGYELLLPDNIKNDENLSEKIYRDFSDWEYKGCEHEYMEYYNCRISNAGGMGWLVGAIEYINKFENIPLLMKYIEDRYGGFLAYENINEFKKEIDIFKKYGGIPVYEFRYKTKDEDIALSDTVSFDMEGHKKILFNKNNIELSVLNGNFLISENNINVFKANDFYILNNNREYYYKNLITNEKYTCKHVFENKCFRKHKKNNFYFEKNPKYFVDLFIDIAEIFYELINASLITKNPIIWC